MLQLFLVSGSTEADRHSFLADLGLLPWAVSLDSFRALYSSPMMTRNARLTQGTQHDELALSKLLEVVEHRMKYGETTFINLGDDARHSDRIRKLAGAWGYEVSDIAFCEADSASQTIGASGLSERLMATPEDFTGRFREVVFVGDIHGCVAPLRRLLSKQFDRDKLFIFVGDLFDRGPENGEVFKIMRDLVELPNVKLVSGNHELHLRSWLNKRSTPGEFRNNTLPQLFKSGFNRQAAERLLSKAINLLQFSFKGARFQVTHGALAGVVTEPFLFPGYQCWRGVGKRLDVIDEAFEKNAEAGWFQVHGHSNAQGRVITPGQRSFNLESSVEFGGKLSALSYDGSRFKDISVKNTGGSKVKKGKAA